FALIPSIVASSPAPVTVAKIAASIQDSFFLKSDGSLWAMGLNEHGVLGDNSAYPRYTPEPIVSRGITAVAAGIYHSLLLSSDGSLWGMGYNEFGQLGDGTAADRFI